jgi:TetR/AcrR family fatty acid metabolism transcriptional regulator
MERARRREQEFNRRRTDIMEQAEKIFAAKGFYGATVAEIADASGYAVGTIYQFFEGKEALFRAMITEKIEAMYDRIRGVVDKEQDVRDKIRALVQAHFRFVEGNRDFCAIFIRRESTAFSEGDNALKEMIVTNYLAHIEYLDTLMNEGIAAGCLRKAPSHALAVALAGMINSFVLSWMYAPEGEALSAKAEILLDIYFRGVEVHEP